MTKILLSLVLSAAILILLLIPKLKKYRAYILVAYAIAFLILNAVQTIRTADHMLPFYHAKEQTFYQKEFAIEKQYPDALLQLLVKGKTVYVKDDLDDYLDKVPKTEENSDYFCDGKYWMYEIYHQINMSEFLEAAGAKVFADNEYNDKTITDEQINDFKPAGYTNDMYRYMFPLSKLDDERGNSFFYYWYYSAYLDTMEIYINTDGIDEADELVILWDDKENETLYVMTKDYYDKEVAANA